MGHEPVEEAHLSQKLLSLSPTSKASSPHQTGHMSTKKISQATYTGMVCRIVEMLSRTKQYLVSGAMFHSSRSLEFSQRVQEVLSQGVGDEDSILRYS